MLGESSTFVRSKASVELTPREFGNVTVDEHIRLQESSSGIKNRKTAMLFLLWSYGGMLIATLAIIFFQGFKFYGFALDASFLNWLGGATIGEIGGLAAIVYGALFKKQP